MSTSEAQLRSEIARLTASINSHKASQSSSRSGYQPRANAYVNPNYKPPSRTYVRPTPPVSRPPSSSSSEPKEVVLGGVAFQSSSRSLVRKGLPTPIPSAAKKNELTARPGSQPYPRKIGHAVPNYAYKSRPIPARRGAPRKRNMTLDNNIRPQSSKNSAKRMKYSDKQCPRFSVTGICSRGHTCLYQHDSDKIAICWKFLQGNCSSTAGTCNLSHDPTPERTPLCVHFLNKGRCTREGCPFPHVNVGARTGICRDFAVLGYCARGLDCDRQHVKECPDFAETGNCTTKGCKLPHVIRANRHRKAPATATTPAAATSGVSSSSPSSGAANSDSSMPVITAEDAQLGDEYISLTFKESDSEDESEDDDDDDEADDAMDSEESEEATEEVQMSEG
ncbi:hypothetical protein HGRIS_002048 [Hohenbuehelia grisea]|uniref:C3H1-type domain-containing protein n=1 Tax=Hohenbuehelia grisea TaxID=104357 RepID=A0ABR3JJD6_9AGAR